MHGNPYVKTVLQGTAGVTSLSTWGHTASACCADSTMKIWDLDTRQCLTEARLPSYPHALVQLGPDAAVVACDSQVCQYSKKAPACASMSSLQQWSSTVLDRLCGIAADTSSWFCNCMNWPNRRGLASACACDKHLQAIGAFQMGFGSSLPDLAAGWGLKPAALTA